MFCLNSNKIDYRPSLFIYNGINTSVFSSRLYREWIRDLTNLYPGFLDWINNTSQINTKTVLFSDSWNTGEPLGVAIYKIKRNNTVKISNFYLREDVRGIGLGKVFGRTLLNLLSHYSSSKVAYLTVKKETGLKSFYTSLGFSVIERKLDEDVLQIETTRGFPSGVGYNGFGILPIKPHYISDFLDLKKKDSSYNCWRYFSNIETITPFDNFRVLIYASNPVKSIIGECTLVANPLAKGKDRAKEVIPPSEKKQMASSFLLKDFIFYPNFLDLDGLIQTGAIHSHPQRLHRMEKMNVSFINQMGFSL